MIRRLVPDGAWNRATAQAILTLMAIIAFVVGIVSGALFSIGAFPGFLFGLTEGICLTVFVWSRCGADGRDASGA